MRNGKKNSMHTRLRWKGKEITVLLFVNKNETKHAWIQAYTVYNNY